MMVIFCYDEPNGLRMVLTTQEDIIARYVDFAREHYYSSTIYFLAKLDTDI